MEVQDKSVIITGATEGIGLATARLLAENSARIALAARSKDHLDRVTKDLNQQGYKALAVPADMRKQADVQSLVDAVARAYGGVDILINNAGQSMHGRVADLNLDNLRQVIDLNIFGVLYAMQAVIPIMRQAGGGMIVNISSMTSKMALPGLSGYASTKAALNLITDTARTELANDNIRVINVLPRTTDTNFRKNALGYPPETARELVHRPGVVVDTPEYVAKRILEAIQDEIPEQYMDK